MYCLACGKKVEENKLYHDSCFKRIFDNIDTFNSIKNASSQLAKQIDSKKTLTGVQKKISLNYHEKFSIRKTYHERNLNYIIKFPNSYYKDITIMENLVMNLGNICKISTVEHALYPINNDFLYISKRIDRNNADKIPMEDFCQLSNRLTEDKYKGSYESFINIIDKYSYYIRNDKIELLYRILFCFITGNNDMHLKNFSLIRNELNTFQLSQAYDLLNSSLLNKNDNEEVALTINGKKKNLHRKDFLVLAKHYDISEKIYLKLVLKLSSYKDEMVELINHSLLDELTKNEFVEMINNRLLII